jgi:hypothetical protein
MERINLKDSPNVRAVILAAFPRYRKHAAYVHTFGPRGVNVNSYWDGGSRAEYAIVDLTSMRCRALPTATHPSYDIAHAGVLNTENQDVAVDRVGNVTLKRLPVGFALVEAGITCGKAATASVYYSAVALTPTESPDVGTIMAQNMGHLRPQL